MGEFTLAIEAEYQIIRPDAGELRNRVQDVLAIDWSVAIIPENQQSMLHEP